MLILDNGGIMTKGDKVLIAIIVFSSILGLFYNYNNFASIEDLTLYIEVDGDLYQEVKLEEGLNETIEVQTEFGRNIIQIDGKSVKVIEADCSDQLDVKQGSIYSAGQAIVCLPNRLTLELRSNLQDNEIDKMVW